VDDATMPVCTTLVQCTRCLCSTRIQLMIIRRNPAHLKMQVKNRWPLGTIAITPVFVNFAHGFDSDGPYANGEKPHHNM
jgi:hypothetical protein